MGGRIEDVDVDADDAQIFAHGDGLAEGRGRKFRYRGGSRARSGGGHRCRLGRLGGVEVGLGPDLELELAALGARPVARLLYHRAAHEDAERAQHREWRARERRALIREGRGELVPLELEGAVDRGLGVD